MRLSGFAFAELAGGLLEKAEAAAGLLDTVLTLFMLFAGLQLVLRTLVSCLPLLTLACSFQGFCCRGQEYLSAGDGCITPAFSGTCCSHSLHAVCCLPLASFTCLTCVVVCAFQLPDFASRQQRTYGPAV